MSRARIEPESHRCLSAWTTTSVKTTRSGSLRSRLNGLRAFQGRHLRRDGRAAAVRFIGDLSLAAFADLRPTSSCDRLRLIAVGRRQPVERPLRKRAAVDSRRTLQLNKCSRPICDGLRRPTRRDYARVGGHGRVIARIAVGAVVIRRGSGRRGRRLLSPRGDAAKCLGTTCSRSPRPMRRSRPESRR